MSPTEKTIIEAALKLFAEKGFAATSIRDISKAANLKSASLYYYVDNKKDLLIRIMNTYMNELIKDAEEAVSIFEDKEYESKISALIKRHVQNHGQEKLAAMVVDTEYRSLSNEDRVEIQLLRKKYEKIWKDILEQGAAENVFQFENSKVTAFALISLCTGVAHWFKEDRQYSIEEVAEQYIALGLKMIKQY